MNLSVVDTLVSVAHAETIVRGGVSPPRTGASQLLDQFEQDAPVTSDAILDLVAARLAAHAPLAEVLAIVREHAVAVLTEPQTGSPHHFMLLEPVRFHDTNPHRAPLRKLRLWHFLDGPATQSP